MIDLSIPKYIHGKHFDKNLEGKKLVKKLFIILYKNTLNL